MLLRGRSKDRTRKVTPPGPSYMSNEQFGSYLADLREKRVARPSGGRPQPSSARRQSDRGTSTTTTQVVDARETPSTDSNSRSASIVSHRRAQSSFSTYSSVASRVGRPLANQPHPASDAEDDSRETPVVLIKLSEVVPSATYIERGQRWMEKEEAVSLREAMEDMGLKEQQDDELRVHAAAQNEASELVWQHQNPEAINPDAPYRYKEHLRKNSYVHARSLSVGRYPGIGMVTGLARDIAPRSVSGSSSSSDGLFAPRSRVSSGSSNTSKLDPNGIPDLSIRVAIGSPVDGSAPLGKQKSYGGLGAVNKMGSSRRRSSARRNISGEIASPFTGDQIWEEPEQEGTGRGRSPDSRDIPAPLRIKPRNPLNRVQFAQDRTPRSSSTSPEPIKMLSKSEIHRNPPSQSRNPAYTSNPLTATQPPVLNAAAEEHTMTRQPTKEALEIRSDEIRQATSIRLKGRSPKLPTPAFVSDQPGRPIVSFSTDWKPKEADAQPDIQKRAKGENSHTHGRSSLSQPDTKDVSFSTPKIQLSHSPAIQVTHAPASAVPSINISGPTSSVPTINLSGAPIISVSAPVDPSINTPGSSATTSKRPLPHPKASSGRPVLPYNNTTPNPKSHWSPAVGNRATATCHQCQLPIEGRVVALKGVPERFHPGCFICFSCGTGLEALEISPEPAEICVARLDRIQRRARGEYIEEIEGQTMAEDGDERLRFYCHLDWHEQFAPKCKHCKTPIIGEHVVALGEHWHYGHFFCAECGDPFEQGMTHIEKDGYAWCLNCQTKRTERQAPKCKKCKLPVIGQYIEAIGGEWHDECFRCWTCRGGFEDGQIFPKEDGEKTVVLCTRCMERELKA